MSSHPKVDIAGFATGSSWRLCVFEISIACFRFSFPKKKKSALFAKIWVPGVSKITSRGGEEPKNDE